MSNYSIRKLTVRSLKALIHIGRLLTSERWNFKWLAHVHFYLPLMWYLPLPFCKIIKKCVNANAKCSCQNLEHQLALSLLLLAATRGMTMNSYSMEPKRNRNIFCHFFCQEIHVRLQFETTYCKQMHFVQVSEPFVSTATWRPGNSFSNPTIPCRFSDGINGCRLNKDT